MVLYTRQRYSSIRPSLSFPRYVSKSILYFCVSVPSLQTDSEWNNTQASDSGLASILQTQKPALAYLGKMEMY